MKIGSVDDLDNATIQPIFNDAHSAAKPIEVDESYLPANSPYLKSRIIGTTSAKLSYLISQILKYYEQEKILVFYDSDNVAYYIAQMLELLHIKHEIYAKSLAAHLKAEYVVRFDQETQDRVLLMDVRNAAFGLNLPSASRIFFVNPVCRPNIEAQAIKRAHRIGQTQKVYVETLVLKGTIEEKMLERSKRMTRSEHHSAKALEDDGGIREIIQSAKVLPVLEREKNARGQMAPLEESQQLWARPGWKSFTGVKAARSDAGSKKRKVRDEDLEGEGVAESWQPAEKTVRRTLSFVDCSNGEAHAQRNDDESDDEPIVRRWRQNSLTSPLAPRAIQAVHFRTPLDTQQIKVELPSPEFEPMQTSPSYGFIDQYRRVAISQLLNNEPPGKDMDSQGGELVQEILRRL